MSRAGKYTCNNMPGGHTCRLVAYILYMCRFKVVSWSTGVQIWFSLRRSVVTQSTQTQWLLMELQGSLYHPGSFLLLPWVPSISRSYLSPGVFYSAGPFLSRDSDYPLSEITGTLCRMGWMCPSPTVCKFWSLIYVWGTDAKNEKAPQMQILYFLDQKCPRSPRGRSGENLIEG